MLIYHLKLYKEGIPIVDDGVAQMPELKPENLLFVGNISTKFPESPPVTDLHIIVVKPRK